MFELYMHPSWPAPFPHKLLGIYNDEETLIRDFQLTKGEVDSLLDGEVIRDRYSLCLAPETLRRLVIDDIRAANPDGLKEREIAVIEDMTLSAVKQVIHRAKEKIRSDRRLKETYYDYECVKHQRASGYTLDSKSTAKFS